MINTLKIAVEPSFETIDHQARLVVDEKDWLGKDLIGLDPPMLCEQFSIIEGKLLVGRCVCGVVGCDDKFVDVVREDRLVKWHIQERQTLVFDATQYDTEVDRFSSDKSWETVERAAERENDSILRDTSLKHGFKFEWASARTKKGVITLSFAKPAKNRNHQRLLKFEWDGVSVASAIASAKAFRARRFPHLPQGDGSIS